MLSLVCKPRRSQTNRSAEIWTTGRSAGGSCGRCQALAPRAFLRFQVDQPAWSTGAFVSPPYADEVGENLIRDKRLFVMDQCIVSIRFHEVFVLLAKAWIKTL